MSKLVKCAAIAIALSLTAAGVHAQEKYPTKPIRLLTPFAAGGGSDILARMIGPQVSAVFGQQVVVDNRPGAGGTLGAGIAVRSDPDGYTLILVSGSYGANGALHDLPYDTVTGITPVILIGTTPLLVSVHPAVPIKTIKELIAHAKANPNKLNFGSAGVGGLDQLAAALFKLETGVEFTIIPYKGSAPVMTALLSGEVDSSFTSLVPGIPHVKAGRLRALAVTTPKRSRALPDVPTIGETVPGYDVTHWYGMWGPKGIPREIAMRWNREVAKVLNTDTMKKWLEREGLELAGGPPEEFFDRIKSDTAKWKKVVKEAKIVIPK
ncbi:MAG: tripartite tricarboxylate transporter substrate binding protein [Betaproteobacteria bacterium]|nr:tripartite tricarboxylate transporter substrate binding protein [Betaproteobacteria bacterium]